MIGGAQPAAWSAPPGAASSGFPSAASEAAPRITSETSPGPTSETPNRTKSETSIGAASETSTSTTSEMAAGSPSEASPGTGSEASPGTASEAPSGAAPGAAGTDVWGPFTFTERRSGSDARLVVYAPDREAAREACAAAFARMVELDSLLRDDRPEGELARLHAAAGGEPVPVSADLFRVLSRAREVAERSGGAFDPTAGPLTALWREAREAGSSPGSAELEEARRLVGWRKLRLDEGARAARLEQPGMRLDLGPAAKGYAADEALRVLKRRGLSRALVELDGVVVAGDPPPGAEGWQLGAAGAGEHPEAVRGFRGRALCTVGGRTEAGSGAGAPAQDAGDAGGAARPAASPSPQARPDDRRGASSPILDPRSGREIADPLQVTVLAADGLTAAPLAAALSVLDAEGRRRLLQAYPDAQIIQDASGDSLSSGSDADGWKPLFDGKSLAGWKRTEFYGGGEVRVESSFRSGPAAIVVQEGDRLSGFHWTGEAPRTSYEIALEVMKIRGSDFMCGLTFPVADSHASLILGGWGGGVVGISSIDGADASQNTTTRWMDFPPDRWYRVRVRVTPRKIQAWLDDKPIVDQEITGHEISLRAGEIGLSVPIGISTYQTRSAFRAIRLRLLPEAPPAGPDQAPKQSP